MTTEPATALGVSIIGLWLAQLVGVPTPGGVEYISGMLTGVLGAFFWQFVKTQKAREDAAEKGVKGPDLPRLDLYTLGMAMLGAPLGVSIFIWVIHLAGGSALSLMSFGFFLGVGAATPTFVPAAIEAVASLVSWAFSKVGAIVGALGGRKP